MSELAAATPQAFWTFLQVFARVAALFTVAPVFGAKEVPAQVRVGLAAVLSLALIPVIKSSLAIGVPASVPGIVSVLAGQIVIGLLIGTVVALLFAAVRLGGEMIDYQMGFTQAATLNPEFSETASPIAEFQYKLALVVYLAGNGHWLLIAALVRSFSKLPVSSLHLGAGALTVFTDLTGHVLVAGVQIAAPALAVLILLDIAFAFLNRAVPQMQVYFLSMPVKILAGLAVVAAMLPVFGYVVTQMIAAGPDDLAGLLRGLGR